MFSISTLFIVFLSSLFLLEFGSIVGRFETKPSTIINKCINYSKPYIETSGYYTAEAIDYLGYYFSTLNNIICNLFQWFGQKFHIIRQMLYNIWKSIKQYILELCNDLSANILQTFKNLFGSFDGLLSLSKDFYKGIYIYLEEKYHYFSNIKFIFIKSL